MIRLPLVARIGKNNGEFFSFLGFPDLIPNGFPENLSNPDRTNGSRRRPWWFLFYFDKTI
jgi:hypothetical protein